MKLLALAASLFIFVYVVGFLLLTAHNISKYLFTLEDNDDQLVRFFMREIMILLWPLVLFSEEGRHALRVIWTGKEDL